MKKTLTALALILTLGSAAQSKDSTKVIVTKVKTSEDFYRVETKEIGSGIGFEWECRCKDKLPPDKGDTLMIPRPVVAQEKKQRRFMFN